EGDRVETPEAECHQRCRLPAPVVEEGEHIRDEVGAGVVSGRRPVGIAVATLVESQNVVVGGQVGCDLVPTVGGLRAAVEEQEGRAAGGPPVEEVEAESTERRGAVLRLWHRRRRSPPEWACPGDMLSCAS